MPISPASETSRFSVPGWCGGQRFDQLVACRGLAGIGIVTLYAFDAQQPAIADCNRRQLAFEFTFESNLEPATVLHRFFPQI